MYNVSFALIILPTTGHVSEKALYVADTSEGKGERIFSSQA